MNQHKAFALHMLTLGLGIGAGLFLHHLPEQVRLDILLPMAIGALGTASGHSLFPEKAIKDLSHSKLRDQVLRLKLPLSILAGGTLAIMAFHITIAYKPHKDIKTITALVRSNLDEDVIDDVVEVTSSLHSLSEGTPLMKGWANEALSNLRDKLGKGIVEVPLRDGMTQMAEMFEEATDWILAVNVGSTANFFGEGGDQQQYLQYNKAASAPVLRIFTYHEAREIALSTGEVLSRGDVRSPDGSILRPGEGWEAFLAEIVAVHNQMETELSVAIDITKQTPEVLDALLVDGKFLAYTNPGPNWKDVSFVSATVNKSVISSKVGVLRGLIARTKDKGKFIAKGNTDKWCKFADLDEKYTLQLESIDSALRARTDHD